MRSRFIRVGALCVAAATLAAAPAATAATKAKGQSLTIGVLGGITTSYGAIDAELGNRALLYQAVYDSLLHLEPDASVTPWLATKWAYNADNTQLTLTLRSGVKFTDGQAFNAAAAVANLKHLKGSKSIGSSLMANFADAKAVNPTTLLISLSAPDPGFLTYLGGTPGMMESPKNFDLPSAKTTPVGSGPFILDTGKTVPDSAYVYKANPTYWNKAKVKFTSLTLRVLNDGTAMVNAMKAGEIDGGNIANADAVDDLKANGVEVLDNELDWVGLSLVDRDGKMASALKDLRVRQALNMSFDRAAILKGFGAGRGTLTGQVFRKGSPMFDTALDNLYPYNPAKAKQLLADAGFKDGLELSMPKVSGVLNDAIWVLLTDQLAAVGIKAKFTEVPLSDFFTDLLTPKYPAFFMFLEQNSNDWVALNFLTAKTAIWNPAHYSDTTSEDLYGQIQKASAKDRPALLKAYGKYITEQAWYVPFYRNRSSYGIGKKVKADVQTGNAIPFLFNFSPR
jgi:peptide/nickel transport system substrate-binding protein